MRSRHADAFNHDDEAAGYDADVRNEADPIRAGYDALLDHVAAQAATGPDSRVLDLGAGTGNLAALLHPGAELVCVDVSREMTAIARAKLAGRRVRFVQADLLEYFDLEPDARFDAVVSTYAVHHLTASEKHALFGRLAACLPDGGRAVLGDLMFEDVRARREALAAWRAGGGAALADGVEEEFFWDLAHDRRALERAGFECQAKRFSALSWSVTATRRA